MKKKKPISDHEKLERKAKPSLEKAAIVLSSFQHRTNIKKFCAQHGVPRSTFYRWRRLLLTKLAI